MPTKILQINELAKGIVSDSIKQIEGIKGRGQTVRIVCIVVGDDPVNSKLATERAAACQKINVDFLIKTFPEDISATVIDERLSDIARDNSITGVVVLVSHTVTIPLLRILKKMPIEKDLEIKHPFNLANVLISPEESASPPLCSSVISTFITHDIDLYQKSILVIGDVDCFCKPLCSLLLAKNSVVTVSASLDDTKDYMLSNADIIIANNVSPRAISRTQIKKDAVLIDAGASGPGGLPQDFTGGGAFCEDIKDYASAILPAGGISLLERAIFIYNVVYFARISEAKKDKLLASMS